MNRALGAACVILSGLCLVWTAVGKFVIPARIMRAEEEGRALAAVEQLLFSSSRFTSDAWFVFVGVAAVLLLLGVGLLATGSQADPQG